MDATTSPASPPPQPAASTRPPISSGGMPRLQEAGLIVVIILIGLLLSTLGGSVTIAGQQVNNFFRASNLLGGVATPMSWYAIMAVGGTCVIIAGGIDISVGSIFALSALACCY